MIENERKSIPRKIAAVRLPTPSQVIRIWPPVALAIKSLINIRARARFVNWVVIVFHPSSSVKITRFPILGSSVKSLVIINECVIWGVDLEGWLIEGEVGFERTFGEEEKGKEDEEYEAEEGQCITSFVRDGIAHLDLVGGARDCIFSFLLLLCWVYGHSLYFYLHYSSSKKPIVARFMEFNAQYLCVVLLI